MKPQNLVETLGIGRLSSHHVVSSGRRGDQTSPAHGSTTIGLRMLHERQSARFR
jgi:hypothetical protein